MNLLSYTTVSHPEWDERIASGLWQECKALTGLIENFKTFNIYIESGGAFAGGMKMIQFGKILWIDSLWVKPSFRMQGIGKALLQKAILFALQNNLKEIQLNTFFKEAQCFFLSCGFENVAVIPYWKYELDCYLMRKIL